MGETQVNPNSIPPIRIATRASRLALWQAHHVADLLRVVAPERAVDVVTVSTIGDRDKSEALTQLGGTSLSGTGIFTREVQAALLDGRGDVAVHSLKDLPTEPVDGLVLAAVPARGAMFDVLVLPAASRESRVESRELEAGDVDRSSLSTLDSRLSTLPPDFRVGTGSPRRRAQLWHRRPDLQMLEARGNVETRLRKLDDGEFDALVLAEAGLTRLELAGRISAPLRPPLVLPAVGQGALAIECRADDAELQSILDRLTDRATLLAVTAERAVLSTLRAGCHAPLGVWTRPDGDAMRLTAVVLSLDGKTRVEAERCSSVATTDDAVTLGCSVAEELLTKGTVVIWIRASQT